MRDEEERLGVEQRAFYVSLFEVWRGDVNIEGPHQGLGPLGRQHSFVSFPVPDLSQRRHCFSTVSFEVYIFMLFLDEK